MSHTIGLSFRGLREIQFPIGSGSALQPSTGIGFFAPHQTVVGTCVQLAIFAFAQGGDIAVNAGTLVFHNGIHTPNFPHDGQGIAIDSARQIPADGCP